ncbi:G5 domain-containing protein [Demequina sp. SYSU T00192]|uniref:G5 domain-containing protein n=1 Tax=Demequina litoralis TaxID=3051660 RepID=A0ABT8G8W0_9MICO|nr:G5 domain-containing protein [Demequina sp. SYSU T00192]MDN4475566.1 G5 domain-containing protein [Demequina sp. SYSU T00192]
MSYRRSNPMPGGRRERRAERGVRTRVLTQVGLGVAVASFAVGSIAAAAVPALTDEQPAATQADLAALPEIATQKSDGAVVKTETKEVAIKPGSVKQDDPDLEKGTEEVVTEGEPGSRVITYDVTYVDGEEVSRVETLTLTVEQPTDEVIAVGTKEETEEATASTSVPATSSVSPGTARALGQQMAASMYGWTGSEWSCLDALWQRESGWNPNAHNPYSGAHGIPQALPGSKMATAGADWATNPATQITWGLGYISGRYGTPCSAWGHSESVGWY